MKPLTLENLAEQFANLEIEVRQKLQSSILSHPSLLRAPFAPCTSGLNPISELRNVRSSTSQLLTQATAKLPNAELPKFDGTDLEDYCKEFLRFFRLTGMMEGEDQIKIDWFIQGCHLKIKKLVQKVADEHKTFASFLDKLETLFPKIENDISIREKLKKVQSLAREPLPTEVETLILDLETLFSKLTPNALGEQEKLLLLMEKLHPSMVSELRKRKEDRANFDSYETLVAFLRERTLEDHLERFLQNQRRTQKLTKKR